MSTKRPSIGLLQVLSPYQAEQIRRHGHLTGYTPTEGTEPMNIGSMSTKILDPTAESGRTGLMDDLMRLQEHAGMLCDKVSKLESRLQPITSNEFLADPGDPVGTATTEAQAAVERVAEVITRTAFLVDRMIDGVRL